MENELSARKILFFDAMLTPKIITFVYWLALAGVVIGGLGIMFVDFSFLKFIGTIFGIAIGMVAVRVYCELMIVVFKINENIQRLSTKEQIIDP